jgi:hypothetical protein
LWRGHVWYWLPDTARAQSTGTERLLLLRTGSQGNAIGTSFGVVSSVSDAIERL